MKGEFVFRLPGPLPGADALPPLWLASASPRRRDLLRAVGMRFDIEVADVDEDRLPRESPEDYVRRLSREKAAAVAVRHPHDLVLGADTVVVCAGEILGKPGNRAEAERMLARLSRRRHDVLTGVTLLRETPPATRTWVSRTGVWFLPLTPAVIRTYLDHVDPLDKAGGYAIQDHGEMLVHHVEGLVSNVVGLPVEEVWAVRREMSGKECGAQR